MIKKITQEEALNYVVLRSEESVEDASYFTITEGDDGWDKVTYYKAKEKQVEYPYGSYTEWVYVLSNPAIPSLYKIGMSRTFPEDRRIKELSRGSGVPGDFILEKAFACTNSYRVEQEVHRRLKNLRYNNKKEFFSVTFDQARKTIEEVILEYEK